VMDKIDKRKKDVREIILRGEKLTENAKAPPFLGEKLGEMKSLWDRTNETAKKRFDDLKSNAANWNTFAEKCATLQSQVTAAQKQIDDVKKLYDIAKAKEDHKQRLENAATIKNQITKTFDGVCDANAVLQVLADDDVKVQLSEEVANLKESTMVMKALDEKMAWLEKFNNDIIDFDKICTELEEIVKKDRAELDALIKPAETMKSTDRLVSAMDLADDIRSQEEISNSKQTLWGEGLAPEGKEVSEESKVFVKRMSDISSLLAALIKEADGEAAKYGQDIVLLAAFTNAQKAFEGFIGEAEKKVEVGYASPNNMEEATVMVNDCKAWSDNTAKVGAVLESGKASADKMTTHGDQDALYTAMKARWVEVDKSAKEWTTKLAELAGMWTKQTEMLNKVTSTMVDGGAGAGEQVNLNELDSQMEQIKEMFVKKQEMMKKMSNVTPPDPAQLAA